MELSAKHVRAVLRAGLLGVLLALLGCGEKEELAPRGQTFAELREIRAGVSVELPGDAARSPYPRERLVDGSVVQLEPSALVWLRRDSGARLLIAGPAKFSLRADAVKFETGRVFVDAPPGVAVALDT
ncbi:MAG TPA: hypothetical protein PKA88_25140, partial [Polyangiaceae bacterium]|nr:hypothetical protein [Polyangiaceae bacterium]